MSRFPVEPHASPAAVPMKPLEVYRKVTDKNRTEYSVSKSKVLFCSINSTSPSQSSKAPPSSPGWNGFLYCQGSWFQASKLLLACTLPEHISSWLCYQLSCLLAWHFIRLWAGQGRTAHSDPFQPAGSLVSLPWILKQTSSVLWLPNSNLWGWGENPSYVNHQRISGSTFDLL